LSASADAAIVGVVVLPGLEILNLHAQGGMAEVYRARGRGADGSEYFYAVKRILPEYTRDPEIKRMFIEESRVASLLIHPNVVRVYDLATNDDEDLYIVMEFLEGKDLSEATEDGQKQNKPLPIWFALQVAKEVCLALDYVTTKAVDKNGRLLGLIHRDVSPHNIFLCFDGQVKLTDFGVAKVQESNIKTQVGITKGKLGYMSPEQLTGAALDCRSDLYNVGILLYETIVGKPLFAGASPAEFLQAMVRGVVPPIPSSAQVPPDLEALIRRALDRDRNKRPASGAEFARELETIAQRYHLTAQPGHIAHHLRELYGRPAPPRPATPLVAQPRLKSMMVATMSPPQAAPAAQASPDDLPSTLIRPLEPPSPRGARADKAVPAAASRPPEVDDTPSTVSSVFDDVDATTQPIPRPARTPTKAHGNARALPAPAARSEAVDVRADGTPRIEPGGAPAAANRPNGPAPSSSSGPPRAPTVQVGGASLGGKKKVVPLDDPRKR
jgi:serine/threonine-protein kinase